MLVIVITVITRDMFFLYIQHFFFKMKGYAEQNCDEKIPFKFKVKY